MGFGFFFLDFFFAWEVTGNNSFRERKRTAGGSLASVQTEL